MAIEIEVSTDDGTIVSERWINLTETQVEQRYLVVEGDERIPLVVERAKQKVYLKVFEDYKEALLNRLEYAKVSDKTVEMILFMVHETNLLDK